MRYHEVGLSQFPVIVGPGTVVETSGKFRCFGECPGKVLVAVLLVPFGKYRDTIPIKN